jgi:hypothetical protein
MGGKFMGNSIEQRLSQVEAAIRELQQQKATSEPNWLKEITGSFADDPIAARRSVRRCWTWSTAS